MRVDEAEKRLREHLLASGLDLDRLDPLKTWESFRSFAAQPVEGTGPNRDDDMCLFEYGVFDWADGKGPRFSWSLVRQFSLNDGSGNYDHMEQLRCDLFFEPTPELEALGADARWSGADLAAWARQVEALDGFAAGLGNQPVESAFGQEQV